MLSSSRNLEVLDLTHNKIQSVNKEAFTNTTNLRYLSVSHNLLTELPAGLVNLTNLDASVNILGVLSRKDIEGMSSLLRLNLSSNEISRLEVASFNETPRLTHLDLSRNRLRIIEQSTLAALVSLTELSLAENQLEDINGLLTTQTHLSFLNLSSNLIQWFDYAFIPNSLQILDLQNNRIEEVENYYSLKDGFNLEYLDVSRNRIRNLGVLSLLPSLAEIILSENEISDIGHNTFLSKNNLSRVDLRSNKISVLSLASLIIAQDTIDKPEFFLAGNPFQCSCEMQWLITPGSSDRLPALADLQDTECLVNYNGNTTALASVTSVLPNQFLCEYESHCFSLCMCCDFFGCDCRMQCPDGCSCFHDSTWSANIIQCSARGHREIPPLIPMDATSVFLDGNSLGDLSGQIFLGRSRMKNLYLNNTRISEISNNTLLGLLDLQLLDLSGNELRVLKGAEFTDLVNLRELYLQNNRITSIAEETFRALKSLSVLRLDNNLLTTFPIWELASNPFIIGVYVAENAWTCHCDFVNKFRMFIDGNLDKIIDAHEVKCIVDKLIDDSYTTTNKRNCIESRNSAFMSLNSEDGKILSIAIGCCVMFVTLLISAFLAYKMKDTIKLWIHSKYGVRILAKNISGEDTMYDAYVSYSIKDESVALGIAEELGRYRLCLNYRDIANSNRDINPATVFAAKSSASIIVIMSKVYLECEWEQIKTTLLQPNPELCRNLILILLEDLFDYEVLNNSEIKSFINSCHSVLHWKESKFWTKLRYTLPDPQPRLDKTNTTQLLDNQDTWNFLHKEVPDSGVSSAHISTVSLNQAGARLDSLRFKTKSRQSIPSTVESNNEFIYLTPKPKKARCQSGTQGHGDIFNTHQRSSSEIYNQQQAGSPSIHHQRSKSTLVPASLPSPTSQLLASNINLRQAIQPQPQPPEDQGSAKHIYGSTSFIYKLISSAGSENDYNPGSPGLPGNTSTPGNHIYIQNQQHQRSSSLLSQNQTYSQSPTQQLIHQRSRSAISPSPLSIVQSSPTFLPGPGAKIITSTPLLYHTSQLLPQSSQLPNKGKLTRSSSQLNSGNGKPPNIQLRTATLAPYHRKHPSHSQLDSQPQSAVIHQRSKSTPYQGFVV